MSKRLNVPIVAQTSNNTCWHASALMLWYYWQGVTKRQGPMNTLLHNYSNDLAITAQEFIDLAGKVGLKKVTRKYTYYTPSNLETFLNTYGPLWCAGKWHGDGHIIVLSGIDGEKIYYNDPDGGKKNESNTVLWFNKQLSKNVDGCLMFKDPNAY